MRTINAHDLSPVTVTRARGEEAAPRLLSILESEPVELALDDAELISGSFLDEIIRQVSAAQKLRQVTFVSEKESTIRKLKTIAANRNIHVYWRMPSDSVRRTASPERAVIPIEYAATKEGLSA
jgi:hypothetical protein